jgi:CelD/BcsL family acetyltransferase involved in cellulose biosynthesis
MTQLVLRDYPFGDAVAPSEVTGGDVARRSRPSGLATPIELELVTTFDGFEALEAEWNALHSETGACSHAFQGFNWCWHWCRHYLGEAGTGPSLAIVAGRRSGRLVLVMPLVTQRTAGLVELTWLGQPVSQYGDALAAPEAADVPSLEAAWRFAVARTGADVANLRRVRADSVMASLLAHLRARITATEEAPFLNVSQDRGFAEWETRRQPPARKNRRRQARRPGRAPGEGDFGEYPRRGV